MTSVERRSLARQKYEKPMSTPDLPPETIALIRRTMDQMNQTTELDGPDLMIGAAHDPLSAHPLYAEFAETILERAAERVRKIHNFALPYASDKAFTATESSVIARLTRAALDRDETWIPAVLEELFLKVSLAPTAAKTMPSQSVSIALGHAIEAFPTPEAIAILRNVLHQLRHAGVKKKLQRSLRASERALAGRLEIALRLPLDQPMTKPQLTTLTRCLEASLGSPIALNYEDWRLRLAEQAQAKNLAGSLVWRILDGARGSTAVLPIAVRGRVQLQDVGGKIVAADSDCRVSLWHPSDASAEERSAWRDRVAALQIKQPFKQVFREHYVVPPDELSQAQTAMFSGHVVSIRPFLGLARREGWHLDGDESLARAAGNWIVKLNLADRVYPGAEGWTTTGTISAWIISGRNHMPAAMADISAAALSEMLRSVDLLVSTSGFAITPAAERTSEDPHRHVHLRRLAESPLGAMAQMRQQALTRVLRGWDGMEGLHFDARHLRLGSYAIHLATGRVTRDGEPVTIDTQKLFDKAEAPWLPYDEKLLETILDTALEIAQRHKS